jgi:uncharacterized protein YrrD
MQKGTDTISLPVIAFDTGEKFDKIRDVIFGQHENRVLGFLVDEGGWFSEAKVVPFQNVQAIGPDGVIVPSKESVVIANTEPAIKGVLEHKNVLKGTKIMSTDGRDLGAMVDLYFDEQSGAVEGYEASGGLFGDAATGRSFVPAPQTLKIGEDVAFVPPETADMMEEQVGGIQGALQAAGDKVQETAQKTTEKLQEKAEIAGQNLQEARQAVGDKVQETAQKTTEKVQEKAETAGQKLREASQKASEKLDRATTAAGEKANGAIAAAAVDQAKGRRARRAVRTDEGRIIVPEGQIVTDVVIERVRIHDKEQELLDAVGVERGEAARASASGAMSAASAQLGATTQQAKQGVSDLLDRAKAKIGEVQERSAKESEESAIKRALGRPVTRVVLDRQDNVILNVGELITNEAVDRSRQESVLDILLSSVYDKKPELSAEDLRAPEPGEASLEPRDQGSA